MTSETIWDFTNISLESQRERVQFSCSVVSDCLQPHGLLHARPPCPSLIPRVYSNSCPLSRWCHPTISSSVIPFSSCLQPFPASGSFQKSFPQHHSSKASILQHSAFFIVQLSHPYMTTGKTTALTRRILRTPFVFVVVMATHPSVLAWKNPMDREAWDYSPWTNKMLNMT